MEAGELGQQSGALVGLAEDPGSVLSPYMAAHNCLEFPVPEDPSPFLASAALSAFSSLQKININKTLKPLNLCLQMED